MDAKEDSIEAMREPGRLKVVMVANTAWYLYHFRLPLLESMRSLGMEVVVAAPSDPWSERFEELGFAFRHVPMNRRGLNPASDVILTGRLAKLYRSERPGYVFHNTIKPVIYGSLAARCAGVPKTVNMIPGLGYVFIGEWLIHRLLRPLVECLYRLALRTSHMVFFQNPDDREYFVRRSLVDPEKTRVTYGSGVDLDYFAFVEPRAVNGGCVFLMVSRLLWDKGIGEYVEAAKSVRRQYPSSRFQLLGRYDSGNPACVDREVVDRWVSDGVLEYLGEQSDVRPALAAADVVVLPSYREGVPRSLLEAMAMGKPIVTTDVPGCRDTVYDGINGLLVPPRDERALAAAMMQLCVDPLGRAMMGRESRKIAVQKFDVRHVIAFILEAMGIPDGSAKK